MESHEAAASQESLLRRAQILLPGLYAWATTVATPASSHGATLFARALALAALIALTLGPLFAPARPELGRAFGIDAFFGLSLACWVTLARSGVSLAPEPVPGILGALGFMVYTFGWGELRGRGRDPEDDPRAILGEPLLPRGVLGRRVAATLMLGSLGALLVTASAWATDRRVHAVMAHAIALGAAVLITTTAARLALTSLRSQAPDAQRLSRAAGAISGLVIALCLGVFWLWLVR